MSDTGTDDSEWSFGVGQFVPDRGQPAPPAPWQPMVIEFRGGNRWFGYFKPAETNRPQTQL